MSHLSKLTAFKDQPCSGLIVCCSDHRFATAHQAHASGHLEDAGGMAWLTIPGGPASLASADAPNAAGARDQADFMLRALKPASVFLVAHDRCAFYEQVCGVARDALAAAQERDLLAAARWVERIAPGVKAHLHRLTVDGAAIYARRIEPAD